MLNEGKRILDLGLKLYATMNTRELHVHVCSILDISSCIACRYVRNVNNNGRLW